jgi:hypothetical protein
MAKQFSVDRARFLAVAAAFAGVASFQACTVVETEPGGDGGASGLAEGGKSSTAGHAGNGGENAAGAADSAGAAGSAGAGGVDGVGGDSAGGEGGQSDGGAAGAGQCSDSVGVTTSCTGVSTACSHYCNAALMNLKPAVADAAIACLKLDTTSNCDDGYGCLAAATAKGCPEDVAATCATAVTECHPPATGEPSCEQLLSGMNPAARAEATTCIEDSCYSVYSCAEGLFFE